MKYYIDTTDEYYPRVVDGVNLFILPVGRDPMYCRQTILVITPTVLQVPDTCFVLLRLPVGDELGKTIK